MSGRMGSGGAGTGSGASWHSQSWRSSPHSKWRTPWVWHLCTSDGVRNGQLPSPSPWQRSERPLSVRRPPSLPLLPSGDVPSGFLHCRTFSRPPSSGGLESTAPSSRPWLPSSTLVLRMVVVGARSRDTVLSGDSRPGSGVGNAALASARSWADWTRLSSTRT